MKDHFQYLFVGSGVAGATIARSLLKHRPDTSLLMLEAGPEVEAKNRRYWWDYILSGRKPYDFTYDIPGENITEGDIDWGYYSSRVMAWGGSTMHWGAWCLRYKPEDFNLYSNTGEGADWPINYEDLSPQKPGEGRDYYLEAEKYLSVCGNPLESWNRELRGGEAYPRPPFSWTAPDGEMLQAFERCGIEPGKMPIARYRKCMTTGTCKYCPFGSRFNAQYILDDLKNSPLYTGFQRRCLSPVMRILSGDHEKIDGVEYVDLKSGETRVATADTIIICSGTYESSNLLMRSVSNLWPEGIGNRHDLLGRHIVSHSFLRVKGTVPANPNHWVQEFDFPTLMSRTYDSPAYQKDGKIFLFKNRVLPNTDIAALMVKGKTREEIDAILGGPMEMELQAFYEEKGQFRNRLVPMSGVNRFGLPLTKINYLRDPRFADRARSRLKLMNQVLKEMGYAIVYSRWDDPGGHHATSTCRMGRTPEEGVTDRDMKVFGTSNLYVCSNAAFPSCTAVNPTLTLTAMSMRLGDHLIRETGGIPDATAEADPC